ncbi:hypothetical protein J2Y41_002790 [Arthrobacter sp. 1088]|uniref:hypothetical protein n=1 Tax=Arthrobacter sp. 1088 TaxID=2817768 RepID=UPI0028587365|nr:hypothetical protein [Arthrobacter sp. 1088]MDR6687225.1 hypothetical protein [Arthrobacter sp. 1088]
MQTDSKKDESPVTGTDHRPVRKHKLPDPPDPDNLPIDYPGSGWDISRYSPSVARELHRRATHLRGV